MIDFQQVYEQYFTDVYKYVLSLTRNDQLAEDITQETFFKALKNIHSFHGQCKLYVWLCQIAKHTFFSYQEKQGRGIPLETAADGNDIEEELFNQETAFEIHRVLHSLEEPYKEVFSLRTFGELSFRQIGVLFQKTEGWARVTYHRAKIKIKEELK